MTETTSQTPETDSEERRQYAAGNTTLSLGDFARSLELRLNEALKDKERLDWLETGSTDLSIVDAFGRITRKTIDSAMKEAK